MSELSLFSTISLLRVNLNHPSIFWKWDVLCVIDYVQNFQLKPRDYVIGYFCVCRVARKTVRPFAFSKIHASISFKFNNPSVDGTLIQSISNPFIPSYFKTMAPSATPKSPAKSKLSPVKLDAPSTMVTPTKPDKVVIKTRNNVLETTSPNTQLASKFDDMSLTSPVQFSYKTSFPCPSLTRQRKSRSSSTRRRETSNHPTSTGR